MGVPVGRDTLFSLNFADDQVIFAGDEEDARYMIRKLEEEYKKWGLEMNLDKTKYMVIGGSAKDLELGKGVIIKKCQCYSYLGVTISEKGGSDDEINNRLTKGRIAIRQLHPVIWSKEH